MSKKDFFNCPGCKAQNYISFTILLSSGNTKAGRTDRACQKCSKPVRIGISREGNILVLKLKDDWKASDDAKIQKDGGGKVPTEGADPVSETYGGG